MTHAADTKSEQLLILKVVASLPGYVDQLVNNLVFKALTASQESC